MKKKLLTLLVGIVFVGGLIWLASRTSAPSASADPSLLTATEYTHDFGTISMAAGNVMHDFTVNNPTAEPLTVRQMYTSCMCTEAFFVMDMQEYGPFGMPGHGMTPSLNQVIAPGETAAVRAIFDPAAHGPAGVGRINRVVSVLTDDGRTLELTFTATVTP